MRTSFVAAAVVAAIATASLAGCTSAGGSATSAAGSAARPAAAAAPDAKAAAADRSVVTTGTLHLVAGSPVQAAGRIADLVEAAGGHVAQSTEDPTGHPSADLSVRIPAAAFPRTLSAIEHEGRLRDVAVHATDVSATATDYGVRIANLRTSIARLQQLLSKATSSADLVQLEGALTDRQGKLEQLLAQQRTLADQVEYATLAVSIVVPAAAPSAGPATFLGGLVAGASGLARTAAALAVVIGILLPWAVALGVIAAVVAVVVRVLRRRTRPTSA
jgi:hypothetical protein